MSPTPDELLRVGYRSLAAAAASSRDDDCLAYGRGWGHLGGSVLFQLPDATIKAAQHVLDQHNVALQVGY